MPAWQKYHGLAADTLWHWFSLLESRQGALCRTQRISSSVLDPSYVSVENYLMDLEHPVVWRMRLRATSSERDRGVDAIQFAVRIESVWWRFPGF